ncbi:MAG TPA: hypothetical protein VHT34_09135 [Clostridia bacterium]|nr:hypothetical protein [Clostridia bacterium]
MTDKNNKNNKNQTGASFSSDQLGENASEESPNKYSQKSPKSGNTRGTCK